jgi:hypothetical protein
MTSNLVSIENYKEIALDALVPAEWNYKKTEGADVDAMKEKLKDAIKRRGQIQNLIVRELETGYFEVVNGNHRLQAMREMEIERAVCFNLGQVSQSTAELIAVETNELEFEADPIRLGQTFKRILAEIPMIDVVRTTPYDEIEINNHIKALDFNWNSFQSNVPDDSAVVTGGSNVKIELNVDKDLAERLKNSIKRFPTHAEAVEKCIEYLDSIRIFQT